MQYMARFRLTSAVSIPDTLAQVISVGNFHLALGVGLQSSASWASQVEQFASANWFGD